MERRILGSLRQEACAGRVTLPHGQQPSQRARQPVGLLLGGLVCAACHPVASRPTAPAISVDPVHVATPEEATSAPYERVPVVSLPVAALLPEYDVGFYGVVPCDARLVLDDHETLVSVRDLERGTVADAWYRRAFEGAGCLRTVRIMQPTSEEPTVVVSSIGIRFDAWFCHRPLVARGPTTLQFRLRADAFLPVTLDRFDLLVDMPPSNAAWLQSGVAEDVFRQRFPTPFPPAFAMGFVRALPALPTALGSATGEVAYASELRDVLHPLGATDALDFAVRWPVVAGLESAQLVELGCYHVEPAVTHLDALVAHPILDVADPSRPVGTVLEGCVIAPWAVRFLRAVPEFAWSEPYGDTLDCVPRGTLPSLGAACAVVLPHDPRFDLCWMDPTFAVR